MAYMTPSPPPRDLSERASSSSHGLGHERRSSDRRTRGADRRRSPRQPLSVAVRQEILAPPEHPAELHLAQSSDLGLGGMLLWRRCDAADPVLPQHTPLRLAFQLPNDGDVLEVAGEVAFERAAPDGSTVRATGVRFEQLPEPVRLRLLSFLKEP